MPQFTIRYRYEGGEMQDRTFADEASADAFLASLTTRRDAFMFTDITKAEAPAPSARYSIAVTIDTDHPLTDEERDALTWNLQLAVTEPGDDDGDNLRGYGARIVDDRIAIDPVQVTRTTVAIPGDLTATYEAGRIVALTFSPHASSAGYFGPAAEVIDGDDSLDVSSTDGPFWRAVQAHLAGAADIGWEE